MERVYYLAENTAWTEDSWFQTSGEKFATKEEAEAFNNWWKSAHNANLITKFRATRMVEKVKVVSA